VNLIWTPNAAWAATPWQQWQLTNFNANWNTTPATQAANPARDGIPNLMKYAMLLNPNAATTVPQTATRNGSGIDFIFTKNKAATDVTYTVEWSDTLTATSWSSINVTTNVLSDNGTTQQIKATVPAASGVTKRFVHLKVTKP
jgi:hypothetical protein